MAAETEKLGFYRKKKWRLRTHSDVERRPLKLEADPPTSSDRKALRAEVRRTKREVRTRSLTGVDVILGLILNTLARDEIFVLNSRMLSWHVCLTARLAGYWIGRLGNVGTPRATDRLEPILVGDFLI
ncbi:hypothetical protein L484_015488 [Morus notabilis]|uniref:Uncharacterized protein n=1 Tax=Morus notabilis TaxID=981085 RepID=W9RGZ6_9ROSA|nr:hypothetical protein L484_015488 [Morus notabilis]